MTLNSLEERRPIFLLGAGASVEAGVPTVKNLVKSFEKALRALEDTELSFAYQVVIDGLSEAEREIDVELLLSTLNELQVRDNNLMSPFVRQWKDEVEQITPKIEELQGRLRDHIRDSCTIEPSRMEYLHPLKEFVQHFGNLDVFTLNYDAAIEIVCHQREIRYTDGFDVVWNPSQFTSSSFDLRLYKLHGSLLWYESDGPPRHLVKIPVRIASGSNVQYFTDESVSELLIYPVFAKEQHTEPYATLMAAFREALRQASVLVAIGYSFRDSYIKQTILEAMALNPELQMLLVDPVAAEVLNHSDALFPPQWTFSGISGRIHMIHVGTKDALASRNLLDVVLRLQDTPRTKEAYNLQRLRSGEASARSLAEQYVEQLQSLTHIPALAHIAQGNEGPFLLQVLRDSLERIPVGNSRSYVSAATAVLLGHLSPNPAIREASRDCLSQILSFLTEHLVWGPTPPMQFVNLGTTGANPPGPNRTSFFEEKARRLRTFVDGFQKEIQSFEFIDKQLSSLCAQLVKDLQFCTRYFESASLKPGNVLLRNDGYGRSCLVPVPDNGLLDEAARIFDNDSKLPRGAAPFLNPTW